MHNKYIDDIDFRGEIVIMRVDLNVPLENGVIMSNKRIVSSLESIKKIINDNAKLVLFSHLGRVKEEKDLKSKSLFPVAVELSRLLGKKVTFVNETRGSLLEKAINEMKWGDIVLVQNTRYEDLNGKAESKNSDELAKYWASLGTFFVNDAFGTAHRKHASNYGIAKYAKKTAVGYLVEKEIEALSKLTNDPERPYMAIVGGSKVSDKIEILNSLVEQVDRLFIVGGMAYTFEVAKGRTIGTSLFDENNLDFARDFLEKHGEEKVFLPIDYAVVDDFVDQKPTIYENNIPDGKMGLDIGPKTVKKFQKAMKKAKTVVWNGPAGVIEFENFRKGTLGLMEGISKLKNAFTVVGGGDSAAFVEQQNKENLFSHVSTGGGATLEFLKTGSLETIDLILNDNK
ncbi:Phosphoglycerate kinase [Mycoplasmopsis meleagridis]|uniref:Phosphoglycerate kinase n=1 Tax=Mycoplasmopsis meleagridis ATCC 25294 TaxID=1264554 RepID=A0A0F5H1F9_9BACT|nr:phosphoglycerate kinase [Mycoplasmopsis meleagridis]KKB26990.1 Phosphoglycerate kinase [Mycoplasmopsis meleagridis ATCC 25294]OAD18337.1 Phosphoglycerate kinase [Mycoplasmopsis meleagridis]VEU77467.1 Phosphoglycerate kinase [Mycoplasmopsis meleagridis]